MCQITFNRADVLFEFCALINEIMMLTFTLQNFNNFVYYNSLFICTIVTFTSTIDISNDLLTINKLSRNYTIIQLVANRSNHIERCCSTSIRWIIISGPFALIRASPAASTPRRINLCRGLTSRAARTAANYSPSYTDYSASLKFHALWNREGSCWTKNPTCRYIIRRCCCLLTTRSPLTVQANFEDCSPEVNGKSRSFRNLQYFAVNTFS